MKMFYKVDEDGIFMEDVIAEENPDILTHIEVPVPNGLNKARWNGEYWEESMTEEQLMSYLSTMPIIDMTIEDRVIKVEETTATLQETMDVIFGGVL